MDGRFIWKRSRFADDNSGVCTGIYNSARTNVWAGVLCSKHNRWLWNRICKKDTVFFMVNSSRGSYQYSAESDFHTRLGNTGSSNNDVSGIFYGNALALFPGTEGISLQIWI